MLDYTDTIKMSTRVIKPVLVPGINIELNKEPMLVPIFNIKPSVLFGLGVAANRGRPCTQGSVRLRRTASRLRDWANPCALRALKHVR